MADSTMTWTDQINAINQPMIDAEIVSTMFETDPLMGIFLAKGIKKGYFGTPGAFQLTGGKLPKGISKVAKETMSAAVYSPRILIGMLGGGRGVGARGTLPTADNTKHRTRAAVPFTKFAQPLEIWQTDYDYAESGAGGIGNIMKETAEIGALDMLRLLSDDLRTGNPGSATAQEADEWTESLGLYTTCDDATTTGMEIYARRDRLATTATDSKGTVTYPLCAQTTDDTTTAFSFKLIDAAYIGAVTHAPNLFVVDKTLFNNAILPIAMEKGHDSIYQPPGGDLPEFGMVGFKWDAVKYRNSVIISDPYATDATMIGLHTDDFDVHIHPKYAFKTGDWEKPGQGDNDAITATNFLKWRIYCKGINNTKKWTALVA